MRNFLMGLLVAFLISSITYLWLSNSSLNSQVNTLRKTVSQSQNPEIQKLKEDYYLQQLDRDTNLLLVVFPILLAITTIATFAGVREEFKRNLAEVKSDSEKQISEYNKSVIHINNLRSSFSFQFGDKINENFGDVLLRKPLDIPLLIELGLLSCQNYCHTFEYNSNDTEEFKNIVTNYITPTMNVMVEKVNGVEEVKLKNISYAKFLIMKSTFDLNLDKDNLQKFSIIFSKISFSALD